VGNREVGVTAADIEAAVSRVRGVRHVKVTLAEDGSPREIHVVATDERRGKDVARDIETVCAARLGMAIDHRQISVACLEEDEPTRLCIDEIGVVVSRDRLRVRVVLAAGDLRFEGQASGPNLDSTRGRLLAEAGLEAMEQYLNGSCTLVLDQLVDFVEGRWRGLLASVILTGPWGEEMLLGCVLAGNDPVKDPLKAVLNALNRRIAVVKGR